MVQNLVCVCVMCVRRISFQVPSPIQVPIPDYHLNWGVGDGKAICNYWKVLVRDKRCDRKYIQMNLGLSRKEARLSFEVIVTKISLFHHNKK